MARTALLQLARATARSVRPRISTVPRYLPSRQTPQTPQTQGILSASIVRTLSSTSSVLKGLSPDSENPQPTPKEPTSGAAKVAEITAARYEELSNEYMDFIVEKLELLQEERESVDVEYSAGVLTLKFPPNGTYVINKQPPNKQIWLSSPISGPKRYDYAVWSEGQDAKEGTGAGAWVYLRDGSTLAALLQGELGIDLSGKLI